MASVSCYREESGAHLLKENTSWRAPLPLWVLCCALCGAALGLAVAALADGSLPEPRSASDSPADHFHADTAYELLRNITDIGPRVSGSYENEVSAVAVLVAAARRIQAQASPHNRLEVDVHTASGAFTITFFDGLNNVYRDVQSVVLRASAAGSRRRAGAAGAGGGAGSERDALLLNCHYDTVPDSPGASDDGAGCAVVLETVRALVAARRPLRRPVLALLNGAEENIMQASHAFVSAHAWGRSARLFVNLESCGAGGRELVFQAGPRARSLADAYARHAPRPHASSLAAELFRSGAVPGDTDFRIFRDHANMSGLDLAWSANGYVYHTALDSLSRVPAGALQRTGDNVLALLRALLADDATEHHDEDDGEPVYFDVLGVFAVCVGARAAAALGAALVLLAALRVHLNAHHAAKHLHMSVCGWYRGVSRGVLCVLACCLCGCAVPCCVGAALHCAGARLAWYARPWLLGPLHACGALGGAGAAACWLAGRGRWGARGWARALCAADAVCLCWAGAVCACLAGGLRSGFVPALWACGGALGGLGAHAARLGGGRRAALQTAGWAPGALQTGYLALGALQMFVPVMGRAGARPASLPPDVLMALLVASLTLVTCSWILPLVVVARNPEKLARWLLYVSCACAALVSLSPLGAPYSRLRPQRYMVFHVRRTLHPGVPAGPAGADAGAGDTREQVLYWVPELDANTPQSVRGLVPALARTAPTLAAECAQWVHCGAPYYLPVRSLIARGHAAPAPEPPLVTLQVAASTDRLSDTLQRVTLNVTGPSHVVVIVSPAAGARVSWCGLVGGAPLAGPRWGERRTYFFTLHDARRSRPWIIDMHLQHAFAAASRPAAGGWARVSASGHALWGETRLSPAHRALLAAFPPWVAATGWGVHMHLMHV